MDSAENLLQIGRASLFSRLACALVAYSVHEHQLGHVRRIELRVEPRSFMLHDDGRGTGLDREGYLESLMGLLAGRADAVQLHGVGLSLIATATPSLRIESWRQGRLWRQTYAWGIAQGAPSCVGPDPGAGTRMAFDVAPGEDDIDAAVVAACLEHWRQVHPGLVLDGV